MDVAAVRAVAEQFDASAGAIEAGPRTQLSTLGFNGASAGRAYAARGDAVRAAMERIADALTQWSRASAEISASLRTSADRYAAGDERAAARLR
ncbi:MAG TPA: type VII secretion target [Mycobacterium sp.]|jgi:uncharacterized protein YukE